MRNNMNQEDYIAISCALLILVLTFIPGYIAWINTHDSKLTLLYSIVTFVVILFCAFLLSEVEDDEI